MSDAGGGVYVIAFAPASMVSFMLASLGPPVAIIGKSGYRFLISLTMYAVFFSS